MHPIIKYPVVGDDVGRIARHEQTLHVRIEGEYLLGQLPAVHLGHHHVGNEQVNLLGVLLGQTDRFTGSRGSQHMVSLFFKHELAELQQ